MLRKNSDFEFNNEKGAVIIFFTIVFPTIIMALALALDLARGVGAGLDQSNHAEFVALASLNKFNLEKGNSDFLDRTSAAINVAEKQGSLLYSLGSRGEAEVIKDGLKERNDGLVEYGIYDPNLRILEINRPDHSLYNAVKVTLCRSNRQYIWGIFGNYFQNTDVPVCATSLAYLDSDSLVDEINPFRIESRSFATVG